jgi:5-methylthioribose kinase
MENFAQASYEGWIDLSWNSQNSEREIRPSIGHHWTSFGVVCSMLEAIRYSRGTLALLEQRKLPFEEEWVRIGSCDDGWRAIRDMTVRGAPAIAISGMLSLAVELVDGGEGRQFASVEEARGWILAKLDFLETSRPTAVNLSIAVSAMKSLLEQASRTSSATPESVVMLVVEEAEEMLRRDVSQNKVMGRHGAEALLLACQARGRVDTSGGKIRVLTHCNTGSLATAAYGTALGVVRALYERDALEVVYCTETRPYNQGARLTAFEIATDHMPGMLVCDSSVAALMRSNRVDAVVVGADRIAENGDTANKIGTFNIAVAAAYHNIPFFVAAPTTTVDVTLANGSFIPIEERSPEEITHFRGERVAADLPVWNPSFDVTPAAIIEGIITELGVAWKTRPDSGGLGGGYHLKRWLMANGADEAPMRRVIGEEGLLLDSELSNEGLETRDSSLLDFTPLSEQAAIEYVAARPHLAIHVGPTSESSDWTVEEVGDGNLNYVFIVKGSQGAVCIKQSPPYVRVIGAGWPLSQNRTEMEADALSEHGKHCPSLVPSVLHFDRDQHILVMQYIPPPHVGLRDGLCKGDVYPLLAGHLATFLSKILFKTSYLSMDMKEFRSMCVTFANEDLCALTEQVIFTEPYFESDNNRHTPGLDDIAADIRGNNDLKLKAVEMKRRLIEKKQALLHGDLHTGSLLVCSDSTYVIDPEFAFVGPIGFDVGKIMANLAIAYIAASGQRHGEGDVQNQRAWLLDCVRDVWTGFSEGFSRQWVDLGSGSGSSSETSKSRALVWDEAKVDMPASYREQFLREVWDDTLGFFGCVIIRRIIGVAHVQDFESIEDVETRAACERRALLLAQDVMLGEFPDVHALLSAIQNA